jgi:Scaffold protein Nfu/NifU N terminal
MGQQVSVIEKPSPRPGVMRFETNRSLTGMGHERFTSMADAVGPRPAAALARQLLSTGKVDSVYIYGNIISVDVSKGFTADGLGDVVRNMYQYWKPGMEMPTFDAPAEEAPTAAASDDTGDTGGGGVVESAYTRLVPQSLRERSAAALAKALAAG